MCLICLVIILSFALNVLGHIFYEHHLFTIVFCFTYFLKNNFNVLVLQYYFRANIIICYV